MADSVRLVTGAPNLAEFASDMAQLGGGVRDALAFRVLLPLSYAAWRRPRGGAVGWYLQMLAHNVLGNRTNLRTGL